MCSLASFFCFVLFFVVFFVFHLYSSVPVEYEIFDSLVGICTACMPLLNNTSGPEYKSVSLQ